MPFPIELNFDEVVRVALSDIREAVTDWLQGRPHSEEAFMNQVTSHLARGRKGCDVGVNQPVSMRSRVVQLHRRGEKQTDRYGADLAITISIDNSNYVKTALFQIKRSNNYRVTVEREQLDEASRNRLIHDRSFVLAADEDRHGIRITRVSDELEVFPQNQRTFSQDCSNWTPLAHWIWQWFSCDQGPVSDSNDPNSVESLLREYVDEAEREPSLFAGHPEYELPEDYLPAKVWLELFFEKRLKP